MKQTTPLHDKLKIARHTNGFSQEYVAKQLHISRQAVSNWENGKSYPDIDNLILLAKLYNTPISQLLDNSKSPNDSSTVMDATNTLSDSQIIMISVIIILSCLFPIMGIIIPIAILYLCRKKTRKKVIVFLCIFCFLINCYNSWLFLNHTLLLINYTIIQSD